MGANGVSLSRAPSQLLQPRLPTLPPPEVPPQLLTLPTSPLLPSLTPTHPSPALSKPLPSPRPRFYPTLNSLPTDLATPHPLPLTAPYPPNSECPPPVLLAVPSLPQRQLPSKFQLPRSRSASRSSPFSQNLQTQPVTTTRCVACAQLPPLPANPSSSRSLETRVPR